MKKKSFYIVCFSLFVLLPNLQAQLKYTTSGKLGIGTSGPLSTFSIGSSGFSYNTAYVYSSNSSIKRGLQVMHYPNSDNYNYALIGSIGFNSSGTKLFGINGSGFRDTNTNGVYTYGVAGYAGRGADGCNYGVLGKLYGDRNGAGIFGCNSTSNEVVIEGDFAGYFAGNVYVTDTISAIDVVDRSDIRAKKNIRLLSTENLFKIGQLNAIVYNLKHPTELDEEYNPETDTMTYLPANDFRYTKDRIGLIAQEVQMVYPELVNFDEEGYLTLNYIDLIPVLIEAIKELQLQISEIEALSSFGADQKSSNNLDNISDEAIDEPSLYQNVPNPFDQNTVIQYDIPHLNTVARINVYDLQGKQVRSYNIEKEGKAAINIPASDLQPGIYIYNLIVDGREIESKRMVLTD